MKNPNAFFSSLSSPSLFAALTVFLLSPAARAEGDHGGFDKNSLGQAAPTGTPNRLTLKDLTSARDYCFAELGQGIVKQIRQKALPASAHDAGSYTDSHGIDSFATSFRTHANAEIDLERAIASSNNAVSGFIFNTALNPQATMLVQGGRDDSFLPSYLSDIPSGWARFGFNFSESDTAPQKNGRLEISKQAFEKRAQELNAIESLRNVRLDPIRSYYSYTTKNQVFGISVNQDEAGHLTIEFNQAAKKDGYPSQWEASLAVPFIEIGTLTKTSQNWYEGNEFQINAFLPKDAKVVMPEDHKGKVPGVLLSLRDGPSSRTKEFLIQIDRQGYAACLRNKVQSASVR